MSKGIHQEILQAYLAQGGTIERFYEWFDATQARAERRGINERRDKIEATAEQRGAIKALRDAAKDLEWLGAQGNIPHPDTSWQGVLACKKAIQAKADQIEDGDA